MSNFTALFQIKGYDHLFFIDAARRRGNSDGFVSWTLGLSDRDSNVWFQERKETLDMEQNTINETSGVSRRGFLAGGLTTLALSAAHVEGLAPVDEGSFNSPSTVLNVDFRRLVSRADLNYDEPASRSEDGMPVGNGTMGSLVWTTPNALHFQINRTDIHAVSSSTNSFPRGSTDYSSGCGYVDINFVDYGEDVFSGPSFKQTLSVYDALMTARGAGVTARVLAWIDQDVFAVEIDDQRPQPSPISIDLRMLRYGVDYIPGRNFELASQHAVVVRNNAHTATSRLGVSGERIVLTQAFEEDAYFNGSAVVIGVSGRPAKARYLNETTVRLSAAPGKGRFAVYIASAASFSRSEDAAARAGEKLNSAAQRGFAALLAGNQAWWHDFWSKGFVHLHSTDRVADYVEQHYTYFLYVMGASSRSQFPPHFNGMIWFTNGDMRQWGAQQWWNNDGCYYEGLIPANRLELMDPLFKLFSGKFDSYAEAAAKQWGSKGVWIPETTWFDGPEKLPDDVLAEIQELFLMRKPWEQRSEKFRRYAEVKQTFNSRWNFNNQDGKWELGLWTHGDKGRGPFGHTTHILSSTAKITYLYWLRYDTTRDEAFLREFAYPMLKGTVEFYRNFPNLKKDSDGKYHIYHVNNHEGIWDAQDTQEELSAIRGITPLAMVASQILNVDAELRPKWQELLDNLAPLPTNETVHARKPGEPVIWVGAATPSRSRIAELPTAFYDLCTVATEDPEMLAIGKATYAAATAAGVNEKTPCSVLSRSTVSAAKMGQADHVKYLVPNQLRRLAPERDDCDWAGVGKVAVLRNRLSMREGPGCLEYERGGIAAQAVHTALLMDSPPAPGKASIIQVFAAWPKEWDAEFTLLARGAFVITSAQRNGAVDFVELKSQAGGDCRLRNPWAGADVVLYRNGRQAEGKSGNLLQFGTAKGEVLLVVKKGTTPTQFKRAVMTNA
jgi:hypothetical protein